MRANVSLKEKQRMERLRLILDYAEHVLLEKGYYAMNMDEIAAGVGIAKGTLYLHFPKKEDLVYTMVEPKMQSFLASVEEAKAYPGDPRQKLEYLLSRELSGAFFQFMLMGGPDTASIFKAREEEVRRILSRIFGGLHDILEEGKRAGIFDPDIPVEMMSAAFFNLFEPQLYKEMVEVGKMPADDYHRYVCRIFFRGIAQ